MSKEIQKVKIVTKKGTLVLTYAVKEADGSRTKFPGVESDRIAHPDLVAAMQKLAIHYLIMTGNIESKAVKDITNYKPELVENCKITSYSIGGAEDDKGITITGYRKLKDGKTVNTNTPFYRFEESEESIYKHMDDVLDILEEIEGEVVKYIDGTKVGQKAQLELFEGAPGEATEGEKEKE